jgi:hypothetical protein
MPKRLYRGNYSARSKAVREKAYANPRTRCWRCHKTYAEAVRLYGPKGAAWQSGHIHDGNPLSRLAPEHARCNAAAGARVGNKMRARQPVSPNG